MTVTDQSDCGTRPIVLPACLSSAAFLGTGLSNLSDILLVVKRKFVLQKGRAPFFGIIIWITENGLKVAHVAKNHGFSTNYSCKATLLKSHFGMDVLL